MEATRLNIPALARLPRRRYFQGPSALEDLPRLTAELGGPRLMVKRDDQIGAAAGGNKTRHLEFELAEALQANADTVITTGAVQSNYLTMTLALANREGLATRLVVEQRVPGSYREDANGNNFLFKLMGAERVIILREGEPVAASMEREAQAARREGRRPFVIPGGGSTPTGACGYVSGALELTRQWTDAGLKVDRVVCASGSGGTHAGLLVGLALLDSSVRVTGISVRYDRPTQEARVRDLAAQTADLLGVDPQLHDDAVECFDEWVGPGYSLPTPEMVAAVRRLARTEGLLLGPVYTGKAMAGLLGLIERGAISADETVVFLHTGGVPSIFAFTDTLLG